jgi:hypothetical protein
MLQQTPSTQNPDEQSLADWQAAPLALWPHRSAMHSCSAAHMAFVVQVLAHRLVAGSQVYGEQVCETDCVHCPLPSQVRMSVTRSPSHWPGLHSVPCT